MRGHDGVLARRAGRGLNLMGEREQGWVRERQLIPLGGGDDADEDTTSVTRQPTSSAAVISTTSAAAITPPTTTSAAAITPTTSAAVRTTSVAAVTPSTTSLNTPAVTPTTSSTPSSTSVVVVSETDPTTQEQAVSSTVGVASSAGASTALGVSPTGTLTAPAGMSSSTVVVSATRVSTDAQGSVIYVTEVQTLSRSSQTGAVDPQTATVLETMSAGNANGTSSAKNEDEDSGGLGTGAIVGISVVAGVVVLGLVLFLVWKLKQKRFASFDDDDADGIKWPELNRHGDSSMNLPLPAKPTGGHGFETNAFERGRTDLDGNLIDDDYDAYSHGDHHPVSLAGSMHDNSPYYHDPSPPLPGTSMSYADTGVYGAGGAGVTRNPSTGAATFLSGHSDDGGMARGLGGSRAFDSRPDSEMMEMTETRNGGLGRSGSGRLL